jgi:hypothetical protein
MGKDEDSNDVPATADAIARTSNLERIKVPVVDTSDVEKLREVAQLHVKTGQPIIIRHKPLVDLVGQGVEVSDLSGLFCLFGKVAEKDTNFAYNIKLKCKTLYREEMLKVADLMGLKSKDGELAYVGERLRYNRKGKEFHCGPGFNYKFLLMLKGGKRWDFVAPEFTPFMSSFEEEKCGIRSGFTDASDIDKLNPQLKGVVVPEVWTAMHEVGTILLFSSQWWHSTFNLGYDAAMIGNKFKNWAVYNQTIQDRKIKRDADKAAKGLPEDWCSVKTEVNTLGTLMWSNSYFQQ